MLNQFSVNWRNEKKMMTRASQRFFIVDLHAAVSVTLELCGQVRTSNSQTLGRSDRVLLLGLLQIWTPRPRSKVYAALLR
jgi:hypothetical protein